MFDNAGSVAFKHVGIQQQCTIQGIMDVARFDFSSLKISKYSAA